MAKEKKPATNKKVVLGKRKKGKAVKRKKKRNK